MFTKNIKRVYHNDDDVRLVAKKSKVTNQSCDDSIFNATSLSPAKKKFPSKMTPMTHEVSSESEEEGLSELAKSLMTNKTDSFNKEVEDDVLSIHDVDEIEILNRDLSESVMAEDVSPLIADFVNTRFREVLEVEKVKEYEQEFPIPRNCHNLQIPQVNKPIWENLSKIAKQCDISVQKQQHELSVATSCITYCFQRLQSLKQSLADADAKREVTEVTLDMGKALALLGSSFHNASIKRRKDMRQCLNPQLSPLLREEFPMSSDLLFG